MARKTVLVSDQSGQEIPDGKGATIRITFHDARKGVRELDVTDAEAEKLGGRQVARRGRRPNRPARVPVVPVRGSARAAWRTLPPAQLAAHLLACPQIADSAWSAVPRLAGESRAEFVVRVVGARPRAARRAPVAS